MRGKLNVVRNNAIQGIEKMKYSRKGNPMEVEWLSCFLDPRIGSGWYDAKQKLPRLDPDFHRLAIIIIHGAVFRIPILGILLDELESIEPHKPSLSYSHPWLDERLTCL